MCLIAMVVAAAAAIALYVHRKVVIAKVENEYNKAHAWVLANGVEVEHKVVNEVEHVWTVTKKELKGIGKTLVAAVEDLKSKL